MGFRDCKLPSPLMDCTVTVRPPLQITKRRVQPMCSSISGDQLSSDWHALNYFAINSAAVPWPSAAACWGGCVLFDDAHGLGHLTVRYGKPQTVSLLARCKQSSVCYSYRLRVASRRGFSYGYACAGQLSSKSLHMRKASRTTHMSLRIGQRPAKVPLASNY